MCPCIHLFSCFYDSEVVMTVCMCIPVSNDCKCVHACVHTCEYTYVCVHVCMCNVVPWWYCGKHGVLPFHRLVVQIPPGVKGVCHFSHTLCCDNI